MDVSASPDWVKDYKWATVRLATFVGRSQKPRLVCGIVSLLSPDRPQPTSSRVELRKLTQDKGTIFFRKVAMTAADAVIWYRGFSDSELRTPLPYDPVDTLEKSDNTLVACCISGEDQGWPALGFPLSGVDLFETNGALPFPFTGAEPVRIHRRFGLDPLVDDALIDDEAVAFLKRRLHIDLRSYSEYQASVSLLAPDPIIRSIDHFVVPGTGKEDVVIQLKARRAGSLRNLSITLCQYRDQLITFLKTIAVPADGLIVVDVAGGVSASGYTISHPEHGILHHQPPLPFLRDIRLNTSVARRRVTVEAPLSSARSAQQESYSVTEYASLQEPGRINDAAGDILTRRQNARARRKRESLALASDQLWLDSRQEAASFLRNKIRSARRRVWFVDPYMGGLQFFQFVHSVSFEVEIMILTSRPGIEAAAKTSGANGHPSFAAGLRSLADRGFTRVSAYVLPGRTSPALHDRFLVVDDQVWTLGNSLNALGERASLVLKVPDPYALIEKLSEFRDAALSFDAYLKQHGNQGTRG
jgi:hypothetical protein